MAEQWRPSDGYHARQELVRKSLMRDRHDQFFGSISEMRAVKDAQKQGMDMDYEFEDGKTSPMDQQFWQAVSGGILGVLREARSMGLNFRHDATLFEKPKE